LFSKQKSPNPHIIYMPQYDQYLPLFEHPAISLTRHWKALEQLMARHGYFLLRKQKL